MIQNNPETGFLISELIHVSQVPSSRRPGGAEAEAGRPGSRRLLAPTDCSPGWASARTTGFSGPVGSAAGISLRGWALASAWL